MFKKLTICVDFDGTIVSLRYPKVGIPRLWAKDTLESWKQMGHTIIVSSCRAGVFADQMKAFLEGWPVDYINCNSQALIDKYGDDPRKISADIYFDDKNAGGFHGWKWAKAQVDRLAYSQPKIICLVGESGSGKTTIAQYIEQKFGIPSIESHTDRPPRYEGEQGHTFHTPQEFSEFDKKDMIAWTKFGDYHYCCLKKDLREFNTYVIDEDGLRMLLENHSDDYTIYAIRVVCHPAALSERADPERRKRDQGRYTLPFDSFDYVVQTDTALENTYEQITKIIHDIL